MYREYCNTFFSSLPHRFYTGKKSGENIFCWNLIFSFQFLVLSSKWIIDLKFWFNSSWETLVSDHLFGEGGTADPILVSTREGGQTVYPGKGNGRLLNEGSPKMPRILSMTWILRVIVINEWMSDGKGDLLNYIFNCAFCSHDLW